MSLSDSNSRHTEGNKQAEDKSKRVVSDIKTLTCSKEIHVAEPATILINVHIPREDHYANVTGICTVSECSNINMLKSISLDVDPSVFIKDLKKLIQLKENIDPDQQELSFEQTRLQNDHSLRDYNIQELSVLKLRIQPTASCHSPQTKSLIDSSANKQCHQEKIALTVRLPSVVHKNEQCKFLSLEAEPNDTIKHLKTAIRDKVDVGCEVLELFFALTSLEDDQSLRDCNIQEHSTLDLVVVKQSMKVYVLTPDDKTIIINVPTRCTLTNATTFIEEKADIPPYLQPELLFLDCRHIGNEGEKTFEEWDDNPDRKIDNGLHLKFVLHKMYVNVTAITPSKEKLSVTVMLGDEVIDLKMAIRKVLGFDGMVLNLYLKGKQLENSKKLYEYNVKDGSTFVIEYCPVSVKFFVRSLTGRTLSLIAYSSDTILHIKTMIEDREGVPVDSQFLVYGRKKLEDHQTLKDCNIQNGSTVILGFALFGGGYTYYIKTLSGIITLSEMDPWFTIVMVKQSVQYKSGIPVDQQRFFFNDRELDDSLKLEQCNIRGGSTLQLIRKTSGTTIHINFLHPNGRFTTLIAQSNDTISTIQKNISEVERISVEKQILVFNFQKLESDYTLAECNIRRESLIHIFEAQTLMQVTVTTKSGMAASIGVNPTDTVLSLKVRISVAIQEVVEPGLQRLSFNGKELKEDKTLEYYLIKSSDTIVVSEPMDLLILSDTFLIVKIHSEQTVINLKKRLEVDPGIQIDRQQLFYDGKMLENEWTLENYEINSKSKLILCKSDYISEEVEDGIDSQKRKMSWSEEGVQIVIPEGTVPQGQDVTIKIRKYDADHSQFVYPGGTKPVSSVYEVCCSLKALERISFSLAKPDVASMCPVIASRVPKHLDWTQNFSPEYHFSLIPSTDFNLQDTSCVIQLEVISCYLALCTTCTCKIENMEQFLSDTEETIPLSSSTSTLEDKQPEDSLESSSDESFLADEHRELPNQHAERDASSDDRMTPSLPDQPTLQDLQVLRYHEGQVRLMDEIAPRWTDLAIALGFEHYNIETIKQTPPFTPLESCRVMLGQWLDGGKKTPVTWRTLRQALIDAGFVELAEQLVKILR